MGVKRIFAGTLVLLFAVAAGCQNSKGHSEEVPAKNEVITLSRAAYKEKFEGFWLGQCIANWTGLITEMDKIGNLGEIKTGDFYTREDWGKPDLPSIWGAGIPSKLSPTIDFIFADTDSIWGSDDDTDIEYIYQFLLHQNKEVYLTGEQIREGWLKHIKAEEENYLWVSNERAFELMKEGIVPPETSNPDRNEHTDMIDAQLTTEIFGLFAPGNPEIALKMAELPIQTTARNEAANIAGFYVVMYSMAAVADTALSKREQILAMAERARKQLPDNEYPAKMYDFVKQQYKDGMTWENTRDSLYQRYQVLGLDGYNITSRELYCNGCFAAGINFGASLISLFYGEGDFIETVKIGALAGWDSDNPTATWGGMLGFMMGKKELERTFNRGFSNQYNIHRTRQNFPNNGLDNFEHMAQMGLDIVDRVVVDEFGGKIDENKNSWIIPAQN